MKTLLTLILLLALPLAAQEAETFRHIGKVVHEPIDEMSGIVKSRTYDDVWWVHNDSGDDARLFAIDGKGVPIVPGWLAEKYHVGKRDKDKGKEMWPGLEISLAANFDWEAIAIADGKLYIGDVGNNGNARRDLGIYVLNEPNPRAVRKSRILKHLPVRYADQDVFPGRKWHYDCEALFVSDGKLYLITKHRVAGNHDKGERGANLHRLDTEFTDRENVLAHVEFNKDLTLPTAADLSPDGRKLAVLTALALWVFDKPAKGDKWLSSSARRVMLPREKTKQAEAVCWDDDRTLRVANEQRDLFLVRLSSLEKVK